MNSQKPYLDKQSMDLMRRIRQDVKNGIIPPLNFGDTLTVVWNAHTGQYDYKIIPGEED